MVMISKLLSIYPGQVGAGQRAGVCATGERTVAAALHATLCPASLMPVCGVQMLDVPPAYFYTQPGAMGPGMYDNLAPQDWQVLVLVRLCGAVATGARRVCRVGRGVCGACSHGKRAAHGRQQTAWSSRAAEGERESGCARSGARARVCSQSMARLSCPETASLLLCHARRMARL
jgi:hypothetical protein